MKNNFIASMFNNRWSNKELDGVIYTVAMSCILYKPEVNDGNLFRIDTKAFVCSDGKLTTHKKIFENEDISECFSYMQTLFHEIDNKDFSIFKFESDNDYPIFVDWFNKAQKSLMILLENHQK